MKKKMPGKKKPSLPPMSVSLEPTLATKTGTWRYLTPAYADKLAPCNEVCPAGEDIEAAMVLAGQEDFLGAWRKITEENPLPRVCGRLEKPREKSGVLPSRIAAVISSVAAPDCGESPCASGN